ncbi:putative CCCH-type zinc finger family protein, partial [Tanacetum coccineum]
LLHQLASEQEEEEFESDDAFQNPFHRHVHQCEPPMRNDHRQGIRTIVEYTEEFYELVSRNDLSDSEEQLVSRYLGGLRQSIQDVLCLYTFWTVSEVYQRALAIEKQQTRSGNRTEGSQNKFVVSKQAEHGAKSQESDIGMSKRPTTVRGSRVGNPISSSNKTFICFKCGEPSHRSSDCRKERGK